MAKKRGNGEGSIYRRKNGAWAAQYTVWTAEGRKRRSVSGKTRAEVSRKLTEAMADRDGGFLYDAGKLAIGEYLDRWFADSVKGTVKETTYANYAYVTREHISPALGRVKLKNLTPAHVRGFYGEKARTNLSAATVKKMHVVLRKALSQAVSDGLIPRNAADGVKPPRVSAPGEEIKPLDSEECAAFLRGITRREARSSVRAGRPLRSSGRRAAGPALGRCVPRGRQARPARAAHSHTRRGRARLGRGREHQVWQGTACAPHSASRLSLRITANASSKRAAPGRALAGPGPRVPQRDRLPPQPIEPA